MNILSLIGSPRKGGNTETLVHEVLSGAAEKDANTKSFHLNDLNIKGCQACRYCKQHEGCAVQDDMQPLYDEIKQADAIVLGSPIYAGQMSAQSKLLIDRCYAFIGADSSWKLDLSKKFAFLFSQGVENTNMFKSYVDSTVKDFQLYFDVSEPIIAGGNVKEQQDVLKQAKTLGSQLANSNGGNA